MWLVNHQNLAIPNALPYIHSANIISSYACLLNHQSKAATPYISSSLSTLQCPWFLKPASSPSHLQGTPSSPSAHSLPDLFIFRSLCVWTWQFIGSVHDFPLSQLPQIFWWKVSSCWAFNSTKYFPGWWCGRKLIHMGCISPCMEVTSWKEESECGFVSLSINRTSFIRSIINNKDILQQHCISALQAISVNSGKPCSVICVPNCNAFLCFGYWIKTLAFSNVLPLIWGRSPYLHFTLFIMSMRTGFFGFFYQSKWDPIILRDCTQKMEPWPQLEWECATVTVKFI